MKTRNNKMNPTRVSTRLNNLSILFSFFFIPPPVSCPGRFLCLSDLTHQFLIASLLSSRARCPRLLLISCHTPGISLSFKVIGFLSAGTKKKKKKVYMVLRNKGINKKPILYRSDFWTIMGATILGLVEKMLEVALNK